MTTTAVVASMATRRLREAAQRSGVVEGPDGVPRVIQYISYRADLYMFLVLLFDGQVLCVDAGWAGLGLMDKPKERHYRAVFNFVTDNLKDIVVWGKAHD